MAGYSQRFIEYSDGTYRKLINLGDMYWMVIVPHHQWNTRISRVLRVWIQHKEDGKEYPFPFGTIEPVDPVEAVDLVCCLCRKQFKNRKSLSEHTKHCTPEDQFNHVTYNLRNYGNENPKWLTSRLLYQVLSDIPRAIPKLMEKKHFNDEFPENKNLRIDTKKNINKRIQVFEDGRWKLKDSKHVFYKVIVDMYDILSEALDEDDYYRHSQRFMKKVQRIRPVWDMFRETMKNQKGRIDYWEDLKTLLLDRHLAMEQN